MYPNYVGQSLRQLSGDVRNFAEAPSRNAYRQSMAELENAKFEAQKPMIEIQAGEAKEQLRPATMQDVISEGMPEHIKAAILADNNIDGQPSAIDRIFATTGVTKGDDDVLYRDGKPVPYYAWRSPRYQQKVTGVLKSIIKPNKYAQFESAYLEPKIKDGTATPEEIAKYKKFSEITPEQNRAALQKHGQDLRWLYADAMRRGDKVEAENIWRDAEYNAKQIESIDAAAAADLKFQREKELEQFKAGLKDDEKTSWDVWMNPNDRNQTVLVKNGQKPPEGFVEWYKPDLTETKPEMTETQALKRLSAIQTAKHRLEKTGGIDAETFATLPTTLQDYLRGKDPAEALEALNREANFIEKKYAPSTTTKVPSEPDKEIAAAVQKAHPGAVWGKVPDTGNMGWIIEQNGSTFEIVPEGL